MLNSSFGAKNSFSFLAGIVQECHLLVGTLRLTGQRLILAAAARRTLPAPPVVSRGAAFPEFPRQHKKSAGGKYKALIITFSCISRFTLSFYLPRKGEHSPNSAGHEAQGIPVSCNGVGIRFLQPWEGFMFIFGLLLSSYLHISSFKHLNLKLSVKWFYNSWLRPSDQASVCHGVKGKTDKPVNETCNPRFICTGGISSRLDSESTDTITFPKPKEAIYGPYSSGKGNTAPLPASNSMVSTQKSKPEWRIPAQQMESEVHIPSQTQVFDGINHSVRIMRFLLVFFILSSPELL